MSVSATYRQVPYSCPQPRMVGAGNGSSRVVVKCWLPRVDLSLQASVSAGWGWR